MRLRRRISRRTLLGGAAVGAAALTGGAALALRGRDEPRSDAAPGEETPVREATATATAIEPVSTPSSTPIPRGGEARLVARTSFSFDTFDAALSGEPSTVEVLGRTHERLVDWVSFEDGTLGAALAAEWEQADAQTIVLHLRDGAKWHAAVHGFERPLSAGDVAAHLERVVALAGGGGMPPAQRPWEYASFESIQSPSDATVVIKTSRPDPFAVMALAGRFALVQQVAAVEALADPLSQRDPSSLVGSGSWIYAGEMDGRLRFESAGRTNLEGLDVHPAGGDRAAFLDRRLDEYIASDRRDAPEVRAVAPGALEAVLYEDSPVISSMSVAGPPWSNAALRAALSGALHRGWLSEALFAARADPAGIASPGVASRFRLPERELAAYPGYGTDAEQDAADARAAWEAAGGSALGPLTIDFPAIFDPRYGASTVVAGRLSQVLGVEVRAAVDSYPNISARALEGGYGNGSFRTWFGWGPPLSEPDPSRWLIETYRSGSAAAAAAGFSDPSVDSALERLATEFDAAARAEFCREAERLLMEDAGGGILPWLLQRAEYFRWPYLGGPGHTPFWDQHLDRERYLDAGQAGFDSRPS